MPDYQFTFTVLNISPQKATAIRDRLADKLNDDVVTVQSLGFSRTTATYRVIGVDTANSAVFDESTEATDKQAAAQQVVGSSTTKVVALVHTE